MVSAAAQKPPTDPIDPFTNASQAAWTIFAQINGRADINSKDTLWERWARPEDLLNTSLISPKFPSLVVHRDINPAPLRQDRAYEMDIATNVDAADVIAQPAATTSGCTNAHTTKQVNLNDAIFDYARENKLVTGQEITNRAIDHGSFEFPRDARAVKSAWGDVKEVNDASEFHTQTIDGKVVKVLRGFHLAARELPNWFWATWEHKSNCELPVNQCSPKGRCEDKFGFVNGSSKPDPRLLDLFKKYNVDAVFLNYRLVGVQLDFTDTQGKLSSDTNGQPTLLGNSVIEERGDFKNSSCISCHAMAYLDSTGRANELTKANRLPTGIPAIVGSPTTTTIMQTGFLWTFTNRTN
jgi:hypothetical protein